MTTINFEVKTLTGVSYFFEMNNNLSFNEVVNTIVPQVKYIMKGEGEKSYYHFFRNDVVSTLKEGEYNYFIPGLDAHRYIHKGRQIDFNEWDLSLKGLDIVDGCTIHLVMRITGD